MAHADPPVGSGPFADGKVIQASGSGTVASRQLQKTSFEQTKDQIKFEIQILSVDSQTRDKIYADLGVDNVQTRITMAEHSDTSDDSQSPPSELTSRHTITTGSIVSSAVITEKQMNELYALAKQSEHCSIIARPRIIAAEGQAAGLQQQVQRPFLANLEQVQQGDETGVQSEIQVLNEGTDITVRADTSGETLNVHTKIQQSRVADVQQHNVYGVGSGQGTIQVPSYEVRQASAVAQLLPNQTLLLDPYFQSKQTKVTTVGTPMLDQLPYVSKAFSATETEEVTLHTIVLLRAKKL